jgi:hypothetical protein
MMDVRIKEVTGELMQVADEATTVFGELSINQLNWKPSEKAWSIAQCLDHLITTHSLYFPLLERLGKDVVSETVWERISPFSGFFGRSMSPDNPKKMKTTARAQPSASEIDGGIRKRFFDHQHQMIEHWGGLPADFDPAKTIISSPLLGLATYSLDDCFMILVVHGQRHLLQAKRVMGTEGFPN